MTLTLTHKYTSTNTTLSDLVITDTDGKKLQDVAKNVTVSDYASLDAEE